MSWYLKRYLMLKILIVKMKSVNNDEMYFYRAYQASAVSGERLLSLVEPSTPTLSLPHPSSGLPVLDDMMDSLLGLRAALLAWAFCLLRPRVEGGLTVSFAGTFSFSIAVIFCSCVDTRSAGSSGKY